MDTEERVLKEMMKIREEVSAKQTEIANKQLETADILNRILFILESDPRIKAKGLVEKVVDNHAEIQKLKDFQKEMALKSRWAGGIAGAVVAAIGYWLKYILSL